MIDINGINYRYQLASLCAIEEPIDPEKLLLFLMDSYSDIPSLLIEIERLMILLEEVIKERNEYKADRNNYITKANETINSLYELVNHLYEEKKEILQELYRLQNKCKEIGSNDQSHVSEIDVIEVDEIYAHILEQQHFSCGNCGNVIKCTLPGWYVCPTCLQKNYIDRSKG